MYITEFVLHLKENIFQTNKIRKYLNILSQKIVKVLKPYAIEEKEQLVASTIYEERTKSSKIFTTQQMLSKLYLEVKVKRNVAKAILSEKRNNFKFVKVKDDLALAINDIIEKKFTIKNFEKELPQSEDGLLFLNQIVDAVENFVWKNIPDGFRQEQKELARSREQQVGAKTQEDVLIEPVKFISKQILGNSSFKIVQHPLGKNKFPDYEVVDAKNINKKLIYIDSKGKLPKGTELTNTKILNIARKYPSVKKMLSIKKPGEVKSLTSDEIKELLNVYNIDLKKVKTLYFMIDRRKKKSSVSQAKIQYGKYNSFRISRSASVKSRSFIIQGNEENKWRTIFRIEFRAGDIPTLEEKILKRWVYD